MTPACCARRVINMTRWRSDGRKLFATLGSIEVSSELPVRGQYTDARMWLGLFRLEIIYLTVRLDIEGYKNGV